MTHIEKLLAVTSVLAFVGLWIWAGITDHRQDPDTTEILS